MSDLPKRVIVDQNGHYWRDFGDSLSMCPTTEANEDTEIVAVFEQAVTPADGQGGELQRLIGNIGVYAMCGERASHWDAAQFQFKQIVETVELAKQELASLKKERDALKERVELPSAERLAIMFHDEYERLAPAFGYETRNRSKKWKDAPDKQIRLMVATADAVIERLREDK